MIHIGRPTALLYLTEYPTPVYDITGKYGGRPYADFLSEHVPGLLSREQTTALYRKLCPGVMWDAIRADLAGLRRLHPEAEPMAVSAKRVLHNLAWEEIEGLTGTCLSAEELPVGFWTRNLPRVAKNQLLIIGDPYTVLISDQHAGTAELKRAISLLDVPDSVCRLGLPEGIKVAYNTLELPTQRCSLQEFMAAVPFGIVAVYRHADAEALPPQILRRRGEQRNFVALIQTLRDIHQYGEHELYANICAGIGGPTRKPLAELLKNYHPDADLGNLLDEPQFTGVTTTAFAAEPWKFTYAGRKGIRAAIYCGFYAEDHVWTDPSRAWHPGCLYRVAMNTMHTLYLAPGDYHG